MKGMPSIVLNNAQDLVEERTVTETILRECDRISAAMKAVFGMGDVRELHSLLLCASALLPNIPTHPLCL